MKQEGYTCDGGCGATVVLERHQSLLDAGWWTTYPPHGAGGVIEACSAVCMLRAISRREPQVGQDLRPPPPRPNDPVIRRS